MSVRSITRRLIGVWLMVDGALAGLWFIGLADSMGGRDAISVFAMVARLLVAALSVSAGWLISQGRSAGAPLGSAALLLITVMMFVSAGTGVLPSNMDPSFRWPAAFLQAVGAGAAIFFLRERARERM